MRRLPRDMSIGHGATERLVGRWWRRQMDIRQTVLLVEDDPATSALVSVLIEEAGYRPITIVDHAQIASAVEKWNPRCVILDGAIARTGQGRSWDDAVAIRRTHPALPVVMFSGDAAAVAEANAGVSTRSRAAGFVAGVDKPFVVEEFLSVLRNAMPDVFQADRRSRDVGRAAGAITVFPALADSLEDLRRRDFVSAAVHELRAPLTVMRGQMQLARRHMASNRARGDLALDLALAQVDRMSRMIDAVIEHAKLASNTLTLEVTAFDLAVLVSDAVARHQHEEPPRLALTVPPGLRAGVLADRDCLAKILDNLLDNALKYGAPPSAVDVDIHLHGGDVVVRVHDHGVGVPDDEVARLFTPYFRTTRTRAVSGTGLGLHISRQFAERCGGKLWLESTSDAGSVFALAMPLAN